MTESGAEGIPRRGWAYAQSMGPLRTWCCLVVLIPLLGPTVSHAQIERSVGDDGIIDLNNKNGQRTRRDAKGGNPAVMPHMNAGASATRFDDHIREAARLYRLPEALIRAVMKVESNFDPRAISHANAHGLMQLIPGTGRRYAADHPVGGSQHPKIVVTPSSVVVPARTPTFWPTRSRKLAGPSLR